MAYFGFVFFFFFSFLPWLTRIAIVRQLVILLLLLLLYAIQRSVRLNDVPECHAMASLARRALVFQVRPGLLYSLAITEGRPFG